MGPLPRQFWNPILSLPGTRSLEACYLVGLLVSVLGSSLGPIPALSSEATQARTHKERDEGESVFPCDRPLGFWK